MTASAPNSAARFYLALILLASPDVAGGFSSPPLPSLRSSPPPRIAVGAPFPRRFPSPSSASSTAAHSAAASTAAAASSSPRRKGPSHPPSPSPSPSSAGEAIQSSRSDASALLSVASSYLWLPTDRDLPSHLRTQPVHHERRRRWGSRLLFELGLSSSESSLSGLSLQTDDEHDGSGGRGGGGGTSVWGDERLGRAALAAALPFPHSSSSSSDDDDEGEVGVGVEDLSPKSAEKEGRWTRDALCGLHALSGRLPPPSSEKIHIDVLEGIGLLLVRIEALAPVLPLRDAVEARWAARGLVARLGGPGVVVPSRATVSDGDGGPIDLAGFLPNLDARVAHLPFDIVPCAVDLANALSLDDDEDAEAEVVPTLRSAIPFRFDALTTRSGSTAVERRGTAWVAAPGVGALAYSGKLMRPFPIPPEVEKVMRAVERAVDLDHVDVDLVVGDGGEGGEGGYFDCALCNHYPDVDAACKFHTDPEHGTVWERPTCVVSAGEWRRFAFRPIPGTTRWDEWDGAVDEVGGGGGGRGNGGCDPAVAAMFPGDVVTMWGSCNDDFHHAVYPGNAAEEGAEEASSQHGRVSLVLKRAADRGNGRRGHGLAGEGRRSRRRRGRNNGGAAVEPRNGDGVAASANDRATKSQSPPRLVDEDGASPPKRKSVIQSVVDRQRKKKRKKKKANAAAAEATAPSSAKARRGKASDQGAPEPGRGSKRRRR